MGVDDPLDGVPQRPGYEHGQVVDDCRAIRREPGRELLVCDPQVGQLVVHVGQAPDAAIPGQAVRGPAGHWSGLDRDPPGALGDRVVRTDEPSEQLGLRRCRDAQPDQDRVQCVPGREGTQATTGRRHEPRPGGRPGHRVPHARLRPVDDLADPLARDPLLEGQILEGPPAAEHPATKKADAADVAGAVDQSPGAARQVQRPGGVGPDDPLGRVAHLGRVVAGARVQ